MKQTPHHIIWREHDITEGGPGDLHHLAQVFARLLHYKVAIFLFLLYYFVIKS